MESAIITINAGHDVSNLWVMVSVSGVRMIRVSTELDNFPLNADDFTPQISYVRKWNQVGTAQVGATHTVRVVVTKEDSNQDVASYTFTDFSG